jgi:hypothetical protein
MNKDEYHECIEEYVTANHPNCVLGPMDLTPMKRHVQKEMDDAFDIGVYMDCFGEAITKISVVEWKFTGRKQQHVDEDVDQLVDALQSTLTITTTTAIRPDEDKRLDDLLTRIKQNRPQSHKSQ